MTYQDLTGEPRREPRLDPLGRGDGPPPLPPGGSGEKRSNWRGKLLGGLVALAAITGFAGIAWYATNQGKKNSATVVPMIQAENSPVKVLPEKPGGMKVPNQDKLIYLQIAPDAKKPGKEKVLPGAEKPMAKPRPAESENAAKTPEKPKPESVAQAPLQPPKMEAPADPKTAAKGQAEAQGEDKKDKEEKKDAALDRDALKAKMEAVAGEAGKGAAKGTAKSEPKAAEKAKADSSQLAKAGSGGAKPAAERDAAAMAKAPGAKASAAGAYQVQLGSSRLEDRALAEVGRLNKAYASILGDAKVSAVRADLGKRGVFFRLWAGPFADRTAAEAMCDKLKARKQGCIVLKR